MTLVSIIVEGPTEQLFVRELLAPLLWAKAVYLTPIRIGVTGHKGGRTNYARVKKDVLVQLKQNRTAYCSTMLDFYGLGEGFPGTPVPPNLANFDKVIHIERAMKEDIIAKVPDLRADIRFLPYIQLHEYEGLLFSDPKAFANSIFQPDLAREFESVRQPFTTPEDIDDGPDTAPSKRVLCLCPSYSKVLDGTRAGSAVGIGAMRRECPHFRDWVERLERIST